MEQDVTRQFSGLVSPITFKQTKYTNYALSESF